MTYHRRRPKTSPFSAANTPIWQVNDDRISTVVTGTAIAMFSSVGGGGQLPCACARATKYIANRPAKNISSLESQMMVPTLTMLGRFSECTRAVMADPGVPTAVVTSRSMTRRSTEDVVGCETRCAVSAVVLLRPRIPAGRGPCEARRDGSEKFRRNPPRTAAAAPSWPRATGSGPRRPGRGGVELRRRRGVLRGARAGRGRRPGVAARRQSGAAPPPGAARGGGRGGARHRRAGRLRARRSRPPHVPTAPSNSACSGCRCSMRCTARRSVRGWPAWRRATTAPCSAGTLGSRAALTKLHTASVRRPGWPAPLQ